MANTSMPFHPFRKLKAVDNLNSTLFVPLETETIYMARKMSQSATTLIFTILSQFCYITSLEIKWWIYNSTTRESPRCKVVKIGVILNFETEKIFLAKEKNCYSNKLVLKFCFQNYTLLLVSENMILIIS